MVAHDEFLAVGLLRILSDKPVNVQCGCFAQVNRLLKALQRDANETDSDHSGDGSNTDSGRGPSEEGGESARTRLMAAANRGHYHCLHVSAFVCVGVRGGPKM